MFSVNHEHRSPSKVMSQRANKSVIDALDSLNPPLTFGTKRLRAAIQDELTFRGWSGQIRVSAETRITISSQLDNVGLCLQLGNMSRFYADMLKLQTLFHNRVINSGVCILPTKMEAKKIGSNVAHFSRFVDELKIFDDTITVPMVVLGFERGW
jgi:hypothetical protein